MKIVQFKQWHCQLKFEEYANNNRVCINLVNADPITEDDIEWPAGTVPIATATVNISHVPLTADEIIIKNYSENEGMLNVLVEAGIISKPDRYVKSGFVECPICKLLVDPKDYK